MRQFCGGERQLFDARGCCGEWDTTRGQRGYPDDGGVLDDMRRPPVEKHNRRVSEGCANNGYMRNENRSEDLVLRLNQGYGRRVIRWKHEHEKYRDEVTWIEVEHQKQLQGFTDTPYRTWGATLASVRIRR